jgi:outer membrane protein assembly factor BamB
MRAFRFNGLEFVGAGKSSFRAPERSMPGGMLSLSSNGSAEGSAIVWASLPLKGDANAGTVEGVLHAFDAEDIGKELWNSNRNGARDKLGMFAKFCPPVVANGKVYVATFAEPAKAGQAAHPNKLVVYGILP